MNSIICPTLLFIENEDWENPDKNNLFLKKFEKICEYVEQGGEIYWSDELDNLLWSQPQLQPWISYNVIPIMFQLSKRFIRINDSLSCLPCKCCPDIVNHINTKDVTSPVLSLIHYLIIQNENFIFIVDDANNHNFIFDCDCHKNKLIPKILFLFDESIDLKNEIEDKWDKINSDNEIFSELLTLVKNIFFKNKEFIYLPIYEAQFIDSIIKKAGKEDNREKILFKIAERLTLTPADVSKYKSFNDELISGSNCKKRSFRINDVCRVYYRYGRNNEMIFLDYTSYSEHNKGTRHT